MTDRGRPGHFPADMADFKVRNAVGGKGGPSSGGWPEFSRGARHLGERLELALIGAGLGMYDISFETGEFFADAGCLDILGYAEGELLPAIENWKKLVFPEDLPRLLKTFQLHLEGRTALAECEYRVRHKSGNWIWVLSRGKVVRWSDQRRPLWFTGTLLDVTWRKRARAVPRGGGMKAEAAAGGEPVTQPFGQDRFFQDLLDAIPCPVFYKDTHGVFLGCNSSFEEFVGLPRDEITGKSSYGLSPLEFAHIYHQTDMSLLRGGGQQVYELPVRFPDGDRRHMIFKKAVFADDNGNPAGFVGVMNDITDLRRAEAALRESERRYREVVENARTIILRIDTAGNIVFINEFAQKFFGFPENEIIGRSVIGTIAPTTEKSEKHLRAMIDNIGRRSGLYKEIECENIRRGGEPVWVNWTNRAIEDGTGRIREILCVGSDTTERRRVEDELRQTNEYLENIFENSPDAIGIVDRHGKFIRWNRMAAELYGYTFGELRGKSAFDMYADREEAERMLATLRAEGAVKKYEIHMNHKAGTVGLYEISIGLLKDGAGEVFGSVCVARDLSPLKKMVEDLRWEIDLRLEAEEALRESEAISHENARKYRDLSQEFHALLDAIPDRLLLIDRDYKVVWANRAAAAEIGKEDDVSSLIGTPCFVQWHQLGQPCEGCPVSEVFGTGRQARGEISTTEGGTLEVRSVPVKDEQGNVVNVINVARDLTEQRRLEKQIRHVQKMQAIGTLAGGIAHDFNNILGIILGYTDLGLIGAGRESAVHYQLEQVQNAVYRARELVKQILAFSRQGEHASSAVRLSSIIAETHRLLRAAVPSNIEIRQKIEPGSEGHDVILADPTQIHQVLMNLCTNAAHAMRVSGGVLDIALSHKVLARNEVWQSDLPPGSYVCLTVSDTGHGMSRETMDRIFEPFFSTKGPGEGTGLGLSVAYGIVQSHKGTISVYSEVGKGSVFRVYFPSCRCETTLDQMPARTLLTGTESILLVDDETDLVEVGKALLERLGYRVVACGDSSQALEIFRAAPDTFDLVITDQTMPHMTGVELAGKLFGIRPHMPIILVTGFSEVIAPAEAHKLGIREFLMKPLITEELSHCIRRVLDTH